VIAGRRYLLRGRIVTVLIAWKSPPRTSTPAPAHRGLVLHLAAAPGPPRNVLIRDGDGQLQVRPFRGLRRPPEH
jgi:hypothetical protein